MHCHAIIASRAPPALTLLMNTVERDTMGQHWIVQGQASEAVQLVLREDSLILESTNRLNRGSQ